MELDLTGQAVVMPVVMPEQMSHRRCRMIVTPGRECPGRDETPPATKLRWAMECLPT